MEENKRRAFSIIRVLAGIIICILIFFIVLAFPHSDHERGRRLVCKSNLHQLAIGYTFYRLDNPNNPHPVKWCDDIAPFVEDKDKCFKCRVDEVGPCSYAMNENIPADAKELPGDLVILFESAPGWNQVGGIDDVVTDRHGESGAIIAFANIDVRFVSTEEIPNLRWTVENKNIEQK